MVVARSRSSKLREVDSLSRDIELGVLGHHEYRCALDNSGHLLD